MRKHPIHIGEMTERIELQSKTLSEDDAGGATVTWTTYATVWAHIRPASGGEREEAMRVEARSRFTVVIRNRTDIEDTHRIKWGSRYMNMRFPKLRGERDLYLEIEAELGVPT